MIDAHQHLWQIGQNGHEWPTPDLSAIYHDFREADLIRTLAGTGVDGTVLVQSQPANSDTEWMLAVAAHTPLIKGVVGWVDFTAADGADRVRALSRHAKLKGLRPMLQGLPDNWILNADFDAVFQAMLETGLTFDALIFTRHLEAIDALAKRYPALRIVIDHGAKPPLAATDPAQMDQWIAAIRNVSDNPNIWCKLSGLPAEMAEGQSTEVMTPCADHLLAVFGAERLIWGSDWPVCLLRMDYAAWLGWVREWLSPLSPDAQAKVLGENARLFYNLD